LFADDYLEGIPVDYNPLLCYMNAGKEGIVKAVKDLMQLSNEQRKEIGQSARSFVLENKNPNVQCAKVLKLLRSLSRA